MNSLKRLLPSRSLTWRIILVNLLVICFALAGLVLWTGFRLREGIIEETEHNLELRALIIANGLREPLQNQLEFENKQEDEHAKLDSEKEDGEHQELLTTAFAPFGNRNLSTIVDSYAEELDARITIFDVALMVRYSSDPAVPVHIEDRHPEIVAALDGSEQHDIRYDEWTNEERLFVAALVGDESNPEGLVQLSIPMSRIAAQVRQTWIMLITAAASLAMLSILASIILGNQLTRPLRTMTAAANRLAAGDLGVRMELEREDELGALAQAFDHMANEISLRLARERAFVANASHELRSPITAIQLRAELLLNKKGHASERAQRYLGEIKEESGHMTRMLEQLLDLNRIQTSQTPAQSKPQRLASPSQCLHHVLEIMTPIASDAGILLHPSIPDDLPQVPLSPDDFELIVRNLVDNAIKYSPAGGEIWLEAGVEEGRLRVTVKDSGVGIPEADLPHIFERFYRVDKARDRKGSGLGLALVKTLVDGVEGEITVQSQEGAGSTFEVSLPLA